MTLIAEPFAADNKVRRDRWQRYLVVPPQGGKPVGYTRATTVAKALDDTSNLMDWSCRMTAIGLAQRPDLLALVATTKDDKRGLNQLCERAKEAGGATARRDLGTALHSMIEQSYTTPGYVVPTAYAADVAAVRSTLAAAGYEVVGGLHERMVVMDRHTIAGTFDLVLRKDGRLFVADVKTGASIDYGALGFAVQLSIYANADALYQQGQAKDGSEDTRTDMPDVDKGTALIVHVQPESGRCDLHALDIAAGLEALDTAMAVRGWRTRKGLLVPVPVRLDPPATAAVEEQSIEDLIAATNDVRPAWVQTPGEQSTALLSTDRPTALKRRIDDLRAANHLPLLKANWPTDIPMGNPTPQHTTAQLDAIEESLWKTEGAVRAPFPGADEPVPAKVLEEDVNYYAPVPYAARGAVVLERPKQPDEGGPLDATSIAELKATATTIRTATPKQWGWVERALRDMRQAGHPLDVSNSPTVRTGALLRALMAVSAIAMEADGDNGVRGLLASVTGSEHACHPTVAIPEFFATLSIDEAGALCALLDMQPTIVRGSAA